MQKKSTLKSIAIAAALMASVPAFAAKEQGPGACQGNCPTNGGGTSNAHSNASATGIGIGLGGQGGAGGQGGQGGAGGSSLAIGQGGAGGVGLGGKGGSVVGSGNSSNKNENRNSNLNSQGQGQAQGQKQGQNQTAKGGSAHQGQSSFNSNDSTAYGSVATTANSVTVEGDNVQYQAARIPVATAYAPSIAPTAVCMGSSSVGGQGMSFGFSLGSSWTDSNCMLLEQVRTVAVVLGDRETASEMLMSIPAYAEARQRVGERKLKGASATAEISSQPMQVARTEVYTDPIVRARLGLPPLK